MREQGTHELEFCLATWSDADGLNALFAREAIVETEKSLVGLNTVGLI